MDPVVVLRVAGDSSCMLRIRGARFTNAIPLIESWRILQPGLLRASILSMKQIGDYQIRENENKSFVC